VVRMFLTGTAMAGGAMHGALQGAPLVAVTRTAPWYRFYAVRDRFPGLYRVREGGAAIEGELYELSHEVMHDSLMPAEPAELELGMVRLEDGAAAFAMLLREEQIGAPGVIDITADGGWRAYRARLG
jgi:hypothetical protein